MNTAPEPAQKSLNSKHPKTTRKVAMYWILVFALLINLVVYVAYFTYKIIVGGSLTLSNVNPVFLLLGITVCTLCLIVWAGHILGIQILQGGVAKAIWVIFIASILSVSARFIANIFIPPITKGIRIEEVLLYNEDQVRTDSENHLYLEKLEQKTSNWYKLSNFKIVITVVVGDYEKDVLGKSKVEAGVALFDDSLSDSGTFPYPQGESEGAWEKGNIAPNLKRIDLSSYEGLVKKSKSKLLFIAIITFENEVVTVGNHRLRILVKDELNKTYSQRDMEIYIAEG